MPRSAVGSENQVDYVCKIAAGRARSSTGRTRIGARTQRDESMAVDIAKFRRLLLRGLDAPIVRGQNNR